SPVRVVEEEEKESLGEGVEVELGGKRLRLENEGQVERLKEKIKEEELRIGPGGGGGDSSSATTTEKTGADGEETGPEAMTESKATTAASSWTEGAKTVLFIRVDFPDAPGEPVDGFGSTLTMARAQSIITDDDNFYKANSYNKTSLTGTVTSVLRMPQTRDYYGGQDPTALLNDARSAAVAAGYPSNHTFDMIAFKRITGFAWAGLGYLGDKGAWLNGFFNHRVTAHELGHNYGLNHANLWKTTNNTTIGSGASQEYNDPFDTMGGGQTTPANHFNAWFKNLLNWLPAVDAPVITNPGTYRIQAYDSISATGLRALKIQRDASTYYWVEFRQQLPNNASVYNGAVIHWGYTTNRQSNLLDMTPTTTGDDEALAIGQTFIDATNGIQIKPLSKTSTYMDVTVAFTKGNLSALALNPTSVIGGYTSQGTITLDSPAPPLGSVIKLSDNLASTTLPASITIPSGGKTATFSITTKSVTAAQNGTVTASFRGVNKTAAFSVQPITLTLLNLNTSTIGGGGTVTGGVTLNSPAPSGGLTVTLSDNIAAANTPASVVVPAGARNKLFQITTTVVTASQSGNITATYAGVTKTAPLTVAPIALASLKLSPTSVAGGVNVTGTAALNGPAPAGGAVVTLSDNLAATTVPPSVTIPGGASSKTFTITTQMVSASQSGTVTATYNSASKAAALTVRPAALLSVTLSPSSVAGGNQVTGTATLDGPAPAGGATVTLSDNLAAATTPASVTIAANAKSATFTITTTVVSAKQTGTVTASRNGVTKTAALSVRPVSVQSVSINPNPIPGGSAATGTITLERLSSTSTVVTLTDNLAATTIPASVTVPANTLSMSFNITTTFAIPSQTGTLSASANGETRTVNLKVVNTASQLILNPSFEQGAVSWTSNHPAKVFDSSQDGYAHTGRWEAWLGGYGEAAIDWLYQDVTIPANARSANLNFYLWLISGEDGSKPINDTLKLQIQDTNGVILSTPATYTYVNKTNVYVKKTFDLLPYKGQTIRIYMVGEQDNDIYSYFFVDDVTLDVIQ
ncbi:MAG TPA: hypothetical protein VE842_07275, partial [Pyrinomonadaceae bacterium]|nr:hypothetical protein [Pyrinomonadaceae bacterium]